MFGLPVNASFSFFLKYLPFCEAELYRIVNTFTCTLLYLHIQDNRILRKTVPVIWAMSSNIVLETIKIRLGGGVNDTCNVHYGYFTDNSGCYPLYKLS